MEWIWVKDQAHNLTRLTLDRVSLEGMYVAIATVTYLHIHTLSELHSFACGAKLHGSPKFTY